MSLEQVYEIIDLLFQVLFRGEIATLNGLFCQDAELNLDLVHPRGVFGRVVKGNGFPRHGEKLLTALHRFNNPLFAFSAQVIFNTTILGEVTNQCFRLIVRIPANVTVDSADCDRCPPQAALEA